MKRILLTAAILALNITPALAQNAMPSPPVTTAGAIDGASQTDPMMVQVAALQNEWARIKYQIADEDSKLSAIHDLEDRAAQVTAQYAQPEAKIWEAIILSTDAGIVKGMSALSKVNKAKDLLESALAQNPAALDGSAHTSLGSLYYQVPGWPIGFGDDEKAEQHLKSALAINPDGIDPNYFYGDFLLQGGRTDEARKYLQHALMAAPRAGREVADAGRRQEIKAALAKIEETRKTGTHDYN